jgi:hypothetical protein
MSTESSTESESIAPEEDADERNTLHVIGWVSVGMAVAALGIFLGAGLRNRYRFKRRTPYDFYANASDREASEFGMGI